MMRRRPAGTCAPELRPSGAAPCEEPLRGSTRIGLFAFCLRCFRVPNLIRVPILFQLLCQSVDPLNGIPVWELGLRGPTQKWVFLQGHGGFRATRRRRLFHHRAVGCSPMHTRSCKPVQLVPPDDHANAQANTSPCSSAPELDVQRRDRQRRCVPQRVLVLKNGVLEPRHTSGEAVKLP